MMKLYRLFTPIDLPPSFNQSDKELLMITTYTKTALFTAVTSFVTIISLSSTVAFAQEPVTTVPASAEDKTGISVGINVIAENSGYDIDDDVTILPSLFYDNGTFYARGSQFGGYLINDDKNELSGFIQPGGSQFDPDDADGALKELDERKWSGMAGVSYLRRTPIGGFRGQVATDITGHSEGTVARLTYLARLNPGKWTIYPSVGLEWANEDYNEYYYGVTQKESDKSGIKTYSPDSSISPYVSVNATYEINKDWDLFLGQSINYLSDEQHDSPMVDDRVGYRTTLGVLYKF